MTTLILFGSRASGEPDEWSDYDLLVVSAAFEGVPFLQRSELMFPSREHGLAYDFLCYTPTEFEDMRSWSTVVREAVRTGRRVL